MKRQYIYAVLVGAILVMFFPLIVAFCYQQIMEWQGVTIHEGNSSVYSIFWLSYLTIPVGLIAIIILALVLLINLSHRLVRGEKK